MASVRFSAAFLLLASSFNSLAQRYAEGIVVSKSTGQAIPYVNVYLKNYSYLGTISNLEGSFKLRVYNQPGDSVIFSHIGYKRKAFSAGSFSAPTRIQLDDAERMLSEIVIMPDSSLLQLLRRAFQKIESNYPSKGMLYEGFYRETNQLPDENKFLYFSESTIQFYKPSYTNRQFGAVKIVKGGKAEVSSRTKYSNIYFYAGVYAPQRFDFVKQRAEFINPSDFDLYRYSIEGVMKDGDREIMEISFKPRTQTSKARYIGKFQLDRHSLAYIGAQFDLTAVGLKERGAGILSNSTWIESHHDVRYREVNGAWTFGYVIGDGKLYNSRYKNHIRYTGEFVTTLVFPIDNNPIKESEAIPYTAIYTQQNAKFTDDYWNDHETIARDSALAKEVKLLFENKELSLEKNTIAPVAVDKSKNNQRLINFALRFRQNFSIGVVPVHTTTGSWSIDYENATYSNNVTDNRLLWVADYDIDFRLNRSFSVFTNFVVGDFSKSKDFTLTRLALNYHKRLAGWRRPLVMDVSAGVGFAAVKQNFGNVAIGTKSAGFMPSIQVGYHVKPRLEVFAGVSLFSVFKSEDKLFIKKDKGFFSTKITAVNLADESVNLRVNNERLRESPVSFQSYPAYLRLGIGLGID